MNLKQLLAYRPETVDELPADTHNPEYIADLNRRLNEQSDRLRTLFDDVGETQQAISYADIMHWKSRYTYLKNVGQAKKAAALAKAEALKEAKAADHDEEFIEGYKEFLATEFDAAE